MDYPVLVNRGKPSRAGHDQENQGPYVGHSQAPAKPAAGAQASQPRRGSRPKAATGPYPRGTAKTRPDSAKPAIRRLRAQLAQAQARIDELQASADTDFLLEIPNRRGFERELHRAISYIKRYHASGALIVLDVDRLKPINDAYGHAAGDQVLKAIAANCTARCAPPM